MLVFVYGTLKRGQCNHYCLDGCSWMGEAHLSGLVLHDLGPFPMAVPGDGEVQGELYDVAPADLARLDTLEGSPRLYERQSWTLADGRTTWVYLGRADQVRHSPRLESGLWNGRQEAS